MAGASPPRHGEELAAPASPQRPNGDLAVRLASAAVMLAILGFALWRGGAVLIGLIVAVGLAVFAEYALLVRKIATNDARWAAALVAGAAYIGLGVLALIRIRGELLVLVLGIVIFTDTGAFFTGRALGGPRIAPRISPSKTWSGLVGGMIAAALWCAVFVGVIWAAAARLYGGPLQSGAGTPAAAIGIAAAAGAGLAIVAQAGDFFESWLKRRAGVKDSSRLIPGHGGIFDRVDGVLPVAIVVGIVNGISGWGH